MTARSTLRTGLAASLLAALAALTAPGAARAQWQANGVPAAPGLYLQSAPVAIGDGAGGVILVWGESYYHQGAYVQRFDATGHALWGANGVQFTNVYEGDLTPADDFAALPDGSGGVFVAYLALGADLATDVYAQHVKSSGVIDPLWPAAGLPVCAAAGEQIRPVLCTDDSGGFIVAWLDNRSGNSFATAYDIYAQRVGPTGVPYWTANGVVAAATPGRQEKPAIVSDGSQGAILTWDDSSPKIYAQRIDGTGARQWVLPARVLCDSLGPTRDGTRIVTDGVGGAIVTWGDDKRGPNSDVNSFGQHVASAGTISWGAGGTLLVASSYAKTPPVPVADGSGGAFLFWADQRNGPTWDVFAKRVTSTATNASGWLSAGLLAGHARAAAPWIAAALDGGVGGAFVAWDDFQANGQGSDTTSDVYAQHVGAGGSLVPTWPVGGLGVTTATQNQAWPALVLDGAGGAFVAWEDARLRTPFPGESYDLVYVSRLGSGPGFVDVPAGPVPDNGAARGLAIRLAANPCVGAVEADFESRHTGPARVELYDVEGRRLESRGANAVAGQAFRLELDAARALRPGLYFVRFAQGEDAATARAVLVR